MLIEYNAKDQLPYQKDLIKELNISKARRMSLVQDMYEEFQRRICNPKAYKVTTTQVWLLVRSREDYWVIGVDGLKTIPREGDDFVINFVRVEFGGRNFKVESVHHELEDGVHKIDISLCDRWVAEGKAVWQ